MATKHVNEYVEEMCDVCYKFKYGLFVLLHDKQICRTCCETIDQQLKIQALEND